MRLASLTEEEERDLWISVAPGQVIPLGGRHDQEGCLVNIGRGPKGTFEHSAVE